MNAEGRRHFVYELHVTNLGRADLTLTQVEVMDAQTSQVFATYSGGTLTDVLMRPGTENLADRRVIAPGLRAVVFVDVITSTAAPMPAAFRHRLAFSPVTPTDAAGMQSVVEGASAGVDTHEPVALGAPLRGKGWLASHASLQ